MPGVFLSYARADGETRAAELRERLAREAPDIEIKQDRLFLEGGIGWWKQVTDAIDSVEFLVLVMTPAAIESGNVQREWRYARQQGVCVYPVKGAPDAELRFEMMPRWMSKAHFYDPKKEWPTLLAHLRKGCDQRRVPFMAPDLPQHFVERPAEFGALKSLLLTPDRTQPVAITTALAGAGGFGKTTLAAALCHDGEIIENFDDGILWVTLGQTPNMIGSLATAYAALTGKRPGFVSVEDAAVQLGQKLEQRTCLLVIDDVWDAAHLRPFLRGGKSAARLFTTRNEAIAREAKPVRVDEMRAEEAVAMLTSCVTGLESGRARLLAQRLGEWPFALELAAAMIRESIAEGDSASHAAAQLLEIISGEGVRALEHPTPADQRRQTVASMVGASLDLLDAAARGRFAELSIFPEDVAIPLAAAASVWELKEWEAQKLAQRLARLSLLKLDLERGVLRLHDVMRSWLAANVAAPKEIHERLVNAWTDWRHLPDLPGEYAWRWLAWHLAQAGRKPDLERILWDPVWMQAKLKATDVNALLADYERLKPLGEAELLQGALWRSAHAVADDAMQFASQMTGRLLLHRESPKVGLFLEEVAAVAPAVWLRPLHAALHSPGTGLVRTLEGHDSWTGGVAVTADWKQAVSASEDKTLKVWDLESGRALRTLEGHSRSVHGVAVTADGKRAVSASEDKTLKVWDLESGRALRTLKGHSHKVNGVAVTADGKRAVSASWDGTLKVWDLETGRELLTLEGHSGSVRGVAVTADGKRAVSASDDETLGVWDLETGRELCTLEGHSASVNGVAVTPDGKRAVSTSDDETLGVWGLETGGELRTLEGHSRSVNGVAVTTDGRRAVSASSDETLKVWDVESGLTLRMLEGHSDSVTAVAVTRDGRRAVSGSWDKTLRVWDLETGRALGTMEGHSSSVTGVTVTPDGGRAVSASDDKTLRLWDLKTGRPLCTLRGHSGSVYGVAVTADGKRAVSASDDGKLKVWDLETGRELRTLAGHFASVSGVAVTRDGRRAVSASGDETLKVWDLESERELRTLEGHSAEVRGVAVTPDGKRAVSASWDNTVKVWDPKTGLCLATFHCDAGVNCCAIARGQTIIAGDVLGRVHFLALEEP